MGLGYHLTEKLKFDPTSGVVLNDGTWVRLFAAWASVCVCFRLASFLFVALYCFGFCLCLFLSCFIPLCRSLLLWLLSVSVSVLLHSSLSRYCFGFCLCLFLSYVFPLYRSSSVRVCFRLDSFLFVAFYCFGFSPCLCLSLSSVWLFVALASVRVCVCLLSFLCVALCCFGFCVCFCLVFYLCVALYCFGFCPCV